MSAEPEYITIVEGPPPTFQLAPSLWNESIYESRYQNGVALVELRTRNGEDIRERCQRAWGERREVQLQYRDEDFQEQVVDVVAMRLVEVPEGDLLRLWVHLPLDEDEILANIENSLDDDDDLDFDD